ncbi:MAG: hypothetical protein EOO38_00045 [Cytophagaceae bacterium]|nr:MAG: hypothetical protein EOO38_00045 [Cytophagaceae bacterium]
MPTLSPIDFAATRRALVAAIAEATQLAPSRIVRRQAGGPIQPPPTRPYASFTYRAVGLRNGQDWVTPAFDVGPTMYRYGGERGLSIEVNFHADEQDDAYGLCLSFQCGLSQQRVRDILSVAGLSVWTVGDARDITALLNTGFEARAFLECELWVGIETLVDLSSIDAVAIAGTVFGEDDLPALTVSTTIEAEG